MFPKLEDLVTQSAEKYAEQLKFSEKDKYKITGLKLAV